jgi:FAD/FMN-containing dehydrogenase
VVVLGDDDYDARRRVWNGTVDSRPAAIVACITSDDVRRCIDVARSDDLPLVVRGTGHHAAGLSTVDGGIVVDLSRARSIDVDAEEETVTAAPGVRAHELHEETQKFGMLVPTGMEPDVGISGLTLGGGEGWFTSVLGLTCDNLIAADVVTAEGEVVRASEDENPDLLWGLRGGGGNLGVVTSFRYRLNRIGHVTAGAVIYPADHAADILRRWRDLIVDAPDELGSMIHYVRTPRPLIVLGLCYAGVGEAAEAALSPFVGLDTAVANSVRRMNVLELPEVFGSKGTESGFGNYWTSRYTDEGVGFGRRRVCRQWRAYLFTGHCRHLDQVRRLIRACGSR